APLEAGPSPCSHLRKRPCRASWKSVAMGSLFRGRARNPPGGYGGHRRDASKRLPMSDVAVLTGNGGTGLSYEAILWLAERATPEFPEGTLDRLDDGLREGVVALNASDLEAIAAFFYEQLDRTDDRYRSDTPAVRELSQAVSAWARCD